VSDIAPVTLGGEAEMIQVVQVGLNDFCLESVEDACEAAGNIGLTPDQLDEFAKSLALRLCDMAKGRLSADEEGVGLSVQ